MDSFEEEIKRNKEIRIQNIFNSFTNVEKGGKALVGEIREWKGKKYKKLGDGKWSEVTEKHEAKTETTNKKDEGDINRDNLYNRVQEEKATLSKNLATKKTIKEQIEQYENRLKFTDSGHHTVRDKLEYHIEMLHSSLKKVERDIEDNKDRISRFSDKLTEMDGKETIEDKTTETKGLKIVDDILIKANNKNITSVNIPDGIKYIRAQAFAYCEDLKKINIPNSVNVIGISAFEGCKSLTTVDIPDSIKAIEQGLFKLCDKLTTVNIPNSVTLINISAFLGCKSLTKVNIPNSVTEIEDFAFKDCDNLKSVHIENPNANISDKAFPEHTKIIYGNKKDNDIEKGGKKALVGEVRKWDGVDYQKTSEGWKIVVDGKKDTKLEEKVDLKGVLTRAKYQLKEIPKDYSVIVWKRTNKDTGESKYSFNYAKEDMFKEGDKKDSTSNLKDVVGYVSEVVKVFKHDKKEKMSSEDAKEIVSTIAKQIGKRSLFMLGASNLAFEVNNKNNAVLSFRIKGSPKVNYISVELNGKDLYNMEFKKIKGTSVEKVASHEDVYADMLNTLIEKETGLYTKL